MLKNYPLHRRHCSFPLLSLSQFLTIPEVPNMDYVTIMKLTQNGTYTLNRNFIQPRIWTSVMTCKLDIAETLNSNKEWLARSSPSSTKKGQWVCCKPALELQLAPDVSMCHTPQSCGWESWKVKFLLLYWTEKKRTFFNGLTLCIIQQWDAEKLPPSQEALFTSSTLIVSVLDHTGGAKHGLRNHHEFDSEWDIFTSTV